MEVVSSSALKELAFRLSHPAIASGLAATALNWQWKDGINSPGGMAEVALAREVPPSPSAFSSNYPAEFFHQGMSAVQNTLYSISTGTTTITSRRKTQVMAPKFLSSFSPRAVGIRFLLGFLAANRKPAKRIEEALTAYENDLIDECPDALAMLIEDLPQLLW